MNDYELLEMLDSLMEAMEKVHNAVDSTRDLIREKQLWEDADEAVAVEH